jgi:hypothetical protein
LKKFSILPIRTMSYTTVFTSAQVVHDRSCRTSVDRPGARAYQLKERQSWTMFSLVYKKQYSRI